MAKPFRGSLPDGWTVAALGDIAEIAFSGVDKKTVEGEVPVRLCNYTDVFYNRTIHRDLPFLSPSATPAERDRWAPKKGDVPFTKDSETPDEIGVPAHVAEDLPDVLCGYHLGRARPDPTRVTGPFLAAALRTHRTRREFARRANGVTRFGLTLNATRTIPVPLPPLRNQRAISSVLDSVDHTISDADVSAERAARLRDMLSAALLPTGRAERHGDPRPCSGTRTHSSRTAPVRVRTLAECAVRVLDTASPSHLDAVPYIGLEHIGAGTLRLNRHGLSGEVSSTKRRFRGGDILFGRLRAYLRKIVRAPFDGICSTDIWVFRPRKGVHRDFLYYCMASATFIEYASSGSDGTRMPRAQWEHLSNFPIRLPSIDRQRALASALNAIDRTLSAVDEVVSASTTLRDALHDDLLVRELSHTAAGAASLH